jgi:hypothetical protein
MNCSLLVAGGGGLAKSENAQMQIKRQHRAGRRPGIERF